MLIEFESIYGDRIVFGKHLEKNELQNAMEEILKTVDEQDFPSVFCARYRYEEVQRTDTIRTDYVIDLDTHLLIHLK